MKPSKAQIEAAAEALALWDSHEPWLRDTWYQQGAEQALEAAFSVAPQRDDTALLRQALNALETADDFVDGHCQTIKVIPAAIAALRARLDGAPQPDNTEIEDPYQERKTLSQKMRDAGFTQRDIRIECDECKKKITPQFLPIHKCTP